MMAPLRAVLACCLILALASGADARQRSRARTDIADTGPLTIMAASFDKPYLGYAADLADMLDQGDASRVLPMVGRGPAQTVRDLVKMRGIDAAIIPSDALAYSAKDAEGKDLAEHIAYLARFGSEQLHIIARSGISSIQDLRDKTINIGAPSEGRFQTASFLLNSGGISFSGDNDSLEQGIDKLKKGQIDAVAILDSTPSPILSRLKRGDGLRLVPIALTTESQKTYAPSLLTNKDYPELISTDETVETISVSTVLAVFKWKKGTARYDRLVKLAQNLYGKSNELDLPNRHASWIDVNLAAAVPGWTRYVAAQEWLDSKQPRPAPHTKTAESAALAGEFKAFAAKSGNTGETEEALFQRFMSWKQTQGQKPQQVQE